MGRICYTTVIDLYNEEHDQAGTDQARHDLIPKNLALLQEACKLLLTDEDLGFVEKVFGYQTRISTEVFIEVLLKEKHFLQPYRLRQLVATHL